MFLWSPSLSSSSSLLVSFEHALFKLLSISDSDRAQFKMFIMMMAFIIGSNFVSTIHSVLLPLIYQISVTNSHTHIYYRTFYHEPGREKKKSAHPSKCCATRCDFISPSLCWHILMFMSHFWIHIGWRFCQNMFSFQFFKNYWFWLWYNKFFSCILWNFSYPIQKYTPHNTFGLDRRHLKLWYDAIGRHRKY